MPSLRNSTSALALVLGAGLANIVPAHAQGGAQTGQTDQNVETVVVTGSRIAGDGALAPTPVTVVGADQLHDLAPANLADGINQLPEFRGSTNPNAGGGSASGTNSPGANVLSLRNLGTNRTLVLLDGRRFVPSEENDLVDVNTLPQSLVQRVEVVTGGASAAYGSDAVAGVVNFILDKKFTGLKGNVQGGISTYGDAASEKASLTYGTPLFGGRGHVIMAVEYSNKDGIGPYTTDRDWYNRNAGIFANPLAGQPGQPINLTFHDGVTDSGTSLGGLIVTGPANLKGQQFLTGGKTGPFQFGPANEVGTTLQEGGEGFLDKSNLSTALQYHNVFARAEYDVTNDMTVYTEFSYTGDKGRWNQYYNYAYAPSAPTIFASNAFLDPTVASQLNTGVFTAAVSNTCRASAGLAQTSPATAFAVNDPARCFTMGRTLSESMVSAANSKELERIVAGVNGTVFDDWKYDAYFNYGHVDSTKSYFNVLNNNNFYAAVDAVTRTDTGQIACAVTVPTAARPATYVGVAYNATVAANYAGCVPINLFGVGSPSQAALSYIAGNESRYLTRDEYNAAASINGPLPFGVGYAPISMAAGVEWREEMIELTSDPVNTVVQDYTGVRGGLAARQGSVGPFIFGNYQPLQGGPGARTYSVTEGFAELNVPVFKDQFLAHQLDFNGAFRVTDYSVSGTVETWKVGVVYEPIADIRLRATRSRDIRAPGGYDLFGGLGNAQAATTSPFTNQPVTVFSKSGGNPSLVPEEADTLTYGIVVTPEDLLPGFTASLDQYKITINNAITTPTTDQILKLCATQNQLCQYITPTPAGATFQTATQFNIVTSLINLAVQKVEGYDLEMSYTTQLGDGQLRVRALGTYQPHNIQIIPLANPVDFAGETGISSNPKMTGNLNVGYTLEQFTFGVQERYVGPGVFNAQFKSGVDIADNRVSAAYYTDISARMKFGDDNAYEAYFTVNNLFNPDPPFADDQGPSKQRQGWTNKALFDTIGRYFTIGVNFKM